MDRIKFQNPGKLVFGPGCFQPFVEDLAEEGLQRIFVLGIPVLESTLAGPLERLREKGIEIGINTGIEREPTFGDLEKVLEQARDFGADGIIGIGGGSVLDTAKLLAAMLKSRQKFSEVIGKDLLQGRDCYLACLPTTSGTGSEVSPNAIFIDDETGNKQGVISPHLVPDAACIDPELTLSLPPAETAATGMDALTHCIEAYANRFAHPLVDGIALEGIRRVASSLKRAVENGNDLDARTDLSLASMLGGMCLGPVNTAAVHALAYPLGTLHKIPHGLSNAILLPWVLRFNIDAAPQRYGNIALALGASRRKDARDTALEGVRIIERLLVDCGLPGRISELGIRQNDIEDMVGSAMQVQRLLKNNPKEIGPGDAREIYLSAM